MSKKVIENVQGKLSRLRKKHAHWQPVDQDTFRRWESVLKDHRITEEFRKHPIIKRIVAYNKRSLDDIDFILLGDKKLTTEERRILMEKKEMFMMYLSILVPNADVILDIENEIDANMAELNTQGAWSPDLKRGIM